MNFLEKGDKLRGTSNGKLREKGRDTVREGEIERRVVNRMSDKNT